MEHIEKKILVKMNNKTKSKKKFIEKFLLMKLSKYTMIIKIYYVHIFLQEIQEIKLKFNQGQ